MRYIDSPYPYPINQFQLLSAILFLAILTSNPLENPYPELAVCCSKEFSVISMPGIKKSGNVTMKKGIFKSDNKFWDWFSQIKMNTIKRVPVTISLLDEGGAPTMVWTLANAWPTKVTGTDLKSDGSEVAVESIEIAHEGLTIANS